MSKYADIEQITKVIRTEWVKYIPMELDVNLSFVLGKISEVPTIDIVRCEDCKFNKKCTLQQYWTVDGFTEEIEYCSLGKRSRQ